MVYAELTNEAGEKEGIMANRKNNYGFLLLVPVLLSRENSGCYFKVHSRISYYGSVMYM